jgi:hypothetical protein
MIRYVRRFSGPDGKRHFEAVDVSTGREDLEP